MPAGRRRQAQWPWMLAAITLTCLAMKAGLAILEPEVARAWLRLWGFVPTEVMERMSGSPSDWLDHRMLGLITALFVHVEWLHLAGNLAYLWVFGIAVERAVGHWRFMLAFVVLGTLANLAVAWQMHETTVPVIGASGGVSAMIGIYLGLFPDRRLGLWLPLGLYLQFARVPALLVIGSWFILQLLYSLFGPMSGAIAWWAHLAGFLGGLITALILRVVPAGANLAFRD